MSERKETKYNKAVGICGGAVYVLEYIFEDGSFRGAVGYSMRPVYQDYIDQMCDPENVAEYYSDMWKQAVACGGTELGLAEYCEQVVRDTQADGLLHPMDDPSFRGEFEQVLETCDPETRKAIEKLGGDCVAWECEGCGRHFSKGMEWEQVFDPKLLAEIEKVEK